MRMETSLVVHSVDPSRGGVRRATLESRPGSMSPPVAVVDVPPWMAELAAGDAVRIRAEALGTAAHGKGGLDLGDGPERGDLDEVGADMVPRDRSATACSFCGVVFAQSAAEGTDTPYIIASAGGFMVLLVAPWDAAPTEGDRIVWHVEALGARGAS